jgi:hypothetical protein
MRHKKTIRYGIIAQPHLTFLQREIIILDESTQRNAPTLQSCVSVVKTAYIMKSVVQRPSSSPLPAPQQRY